MPIIKYKNNNDTELAVWKVTEDAEYFRQKLQLSPSEAQEIEKLHPRKLLEWFASRYLLHLLSRRTERITITKDIHGKPSLSSHPYHISISHTRDYVAIIVGPHSIGIDIQIYLEKIKRIHHKFVSEEEKGYHDVESVRRLHLLWGAKEAMYKAYGKRKLDFKKNMTILPIDDTQSIHRSIITTDSSRYNYNLYFEEESDYILVYVKIC